MMDSFQHRVEVPSETCFLSLSLSSSCSNSYYTCVAAPVLLRPGREGAENRLRLYGASEAAGGDGTSVGSEHAAGGPRP